MQTPFLAVYDDLKDGGRGNSGAKRLKWVRGALVCVRGCLRIRIAGRGWSVDPEYIRVLDVIWDSSRTG